MSSAHGHYEPKEPVRWSNALERYVHSIGTPSVDVMVAVFKQWEELVGSEIAQHCRPAAVEGDRLVVAAADPVWAGEVQWMAQDLLSRINEAAGSQLKSLTVKVLPRTF